MPLSKDDRSEAIDSCLPEADDESESKMAIGRVGEEG
jgi:hypothetical protein